MNARQRFFACLLLASCAGLDDAGDVVAPTPIEDRVEHGYADSDGVRIHYASLGEGPLVVMLHGFPDYWYTWRDQMEALAKDHRVVAMDLRGYNRSDKPKGQENYAMSLLVGDVVAVIRHLGREKAVIVGHDWGAAIAWQFAMHAPQMTEKLVILSVPHPAGFSRELATNEKQREDSQYARDFQKEGAHESLTAEGLAAWVEGDAARAKYVEAFQRSDFEAMLHYYKQNYPKTASASDAPPPAPSFPRVQAPVLVIHGKKDTALNARGHSNTWEWIDADMTVVMLHDAGHFVQQDASARVSRILADWLRD